MRGNGVGIFGRLEVFWRRRNNNLKVASRPSPERVVGATRAQGGNHTQGLGRAVGKVRQERQHCVFSSFSPFFATRCVWGFDVFYFSEIKWII